jgi:hypothetical protein
MSAGCQTFADTAEMHRRHTASKPVLDISPVRHGLAGCTKNFRGSAILRMHKSRQAVEYRQGTSVSGFMAIRDPQRISVNLNQRTFVSVSALCSGSHKSLFYAKKRRQPRDSRPLEWFEIEARFHSLWTFLVLPCVCANLSPHSRAITTHILLVESA